MILIKLTKYLLNYKKSYEEVLKGYKIMNQTNDFNFMVEECETRIEIYKEILEKLKEFTYEEYN